MATLAKLNTRAGMYENIKSLERSESARSRHEKDTEEDDGDRPNLKQRVDKSGAKVTYEPLPKRKPVKNKLAPRLAEEDDD